MGTPAEGSDYDFNPTGEVQGGDPTGSNTPGPNPAWNDVLNVIPNQFHNMVTPHFQRWDQAAQQRIESLQGQYEPYKPFVDHGITHDELVQGLRLMQAINDDPRAIYDQLAEIHKFNQQQNPDSVVDQMTGDPQQNAIDEKYSRLEQGLEVMANHLLEQQKAEQAAGADAWLDGELNGLKQKYGDYDERYVLAYMDAGLTGEQAVQQYLTLRDSILAGNPRPFAPAVMGTNSGQGAGVPSEAIDVTKLTRQDTRGLVAQMLQRAAQQQG